MVNKSRSAGGVYAVILVGGRGRRLMPLSTDERPKAFLSVTRDRNSMFRKTLKRIAALVPSSQIIVVANRMHAKLVRRDFPDIKGRNLILEPVSRNTAPAVALASGIIAGRDRGAVVAVLPTDHYIADEKKHLDCLRAGIEFIKKKSTGIVVLGLKAACPSTQFGYIKTRPQASGARGIYNVEKFVEKPDLAKAKKYLKSGKYLWNSGVFIFNARNFMREVKARAPKIFRIVRAGSVTERSYSRAPDISLDYAIMEKARDIYCVKGDYGWSDVGGFKALKKVLKKESRRFVEKNGKIIKIL